MKEEDGSDEGEREDDDNVGVTEGGRTDDEGVSMRITGNTPTVKRRASGQMTKSTCHCECV